MQILKGKSAGSYALMVSTILSLAATVMYLVFGLSFQTFVGTIFVLPLVATLLGLAQWFYNGFFADYIPPVITALVTASLVLLVRDSIDDFTALFVGMGDYFGHAENAGPRVAIGVAMLLCVLVTIIGSFMAKGTKKEA